MRARAITAVEALDDGYAFEAQLDSPWNQAAEVRAERRRPIAATIPSIAKGRVNELVRRVDAGDPAASRLVVMLLQDTGLDTLDQLRNFDTFTATFAANTECTVASYARLVLDSTDVATPPLTTVPKHSTLGTLTWERSKPARKFRLRSSGTRRTRPVPTDADIVPIHITRLDTAVATNGETFHFRTTNGLVSATEPA